MKAWIQKHNLFAGAGLAAVIYLILMFLQVKVAKLPMFIFPLILGKIAVSVIFSGISFYLSKPPLSSVKDIKAGSNQHGDAHFIDDTEKIKLYLRVASGQETQPGMLVGTSKSEWLVDTSDQSVLMVAPPGAGKSTSVYIPTITYNARCNKKTKKGPSMVIVSVKDDLYNALRPELLECDYTIAKLDLRNVFRSNHYNMMYRVNAEIDLWKQAVEPKEKAIHYATAERYAKILATAIIGSTGTTDTSGSSEYFNETAKGLIIGLILLVAQYAKPEQRHLISVFQLIVECGGAAPTPAKGGGVEQSRLAVMMQKCTDRRILGYVSTTTSADIRTTLNIVSSALAKLLKFVDAEMEQLICDHDSALDSDTFIQNATAIFLIAPDENETRHFMASLFVRFLTDDLIAQAEKGYVDENGKLIVGKVQRPFFYFLDEFGNFPAIPSVTSLFSAIRSRGGRLLVSVQSYAQFLLKYDDKVTNIIKDNCQILLNTFVSPSAQDTATSISKMLGDETILTGSSSQSDGKTTSSQQLMGRPLISPAQMVRIERDTWIVEKAGYSPMKTHMEGYFKWLTLAKDEGNYTEVEHDYQEVQIFSAKEMQTALSPKVEEERANLEESQRELNEFTEETQKESSQYKAKRAAKARER